MSVRGREERKTERVTKVLGRDTCGRKTDSSLSRTGTFRYLIVFGSFIELFDKEGDVRNRGTVIVTAKSGRKNTRPKTIRDSELGSRRSCHFLQQGT